MLTAPTTPCCPKFLLCVGFILPSLLLLIVLVNYFRSWATSSVLVKSEREKVSLVFLGQWRTELCWFLSLSCTALWPESLAWALHLLLSPGRAMAVLQLVALFTWHLAVLWLMQWVLHVTYLFGIGGELGCWVFCRGSMPGYESSNKTAFIWKQKYSLFNIMWKCWERGGFRTIHMHFHLTAGLIIPLEQSRLA